MFIFRCDCIYLEVKLEEGLPCGGAYLKFIREPSPARAKGPFSMHELDNETPYTIMFGPDNCGIMNNKIHFILQHRTGENPYTEKYFNETPSVVLDMHTHLYTLLIRGDNSVEYYIDKELKKSGNMLTHFTPPINPPKTIDDPTDSKPSDWVDISQIPDPSEEKPDDWDDSRPHCIETSRLG